MTYREESYLLDSIKQIKDEVHENNRMLKQIIRIINTYISTHQQENDNDFNRNVLANIVSNMLNF